MSTEATTQRIWGMENIAMLIISRNRYTSQEVPLELCYTIQECAAQVYRRFSLLSCISASSDHQLQELGLQLLRPLQMRL